MRGNQLRGGIFLKIRAKSGHMRGIYIYHGYKFHTIGKSALFSVNNNLNNK
jgi:hypothetical protein